MSKGVLSARKLVLVNPSSSMVCLVPCALPMMARQGSPDFSISNLLIQAKAPAGSGGKWAAKVAMSRHVEKGQMSIYIEKRFTFLTQKPFLIHCCTGNHFTILYVS